MKFEINQVVEIVDNKPVILSTEIKLLTPSTDLYSLARDYIEEYADYEFVQRNQYSGYRIKNNKRRRYIIVLIPQQDRLIICSQQQTQTTSKLFPYLWETVINNLEELHKFFELWNHHDHVKAKA
ncbi:hypothetical protein [Aulosira sp. FACHB-615]|uniref:hypothetical protein n=1 Tax=Aulosira sp. FACHB-615 TaxID=2692777 RepID=UPI00168769D3|nr:hypothetical protein [Aulosira sp. FACHB-615]MBD2492079.1 hypothetical protein [Aulosira sp. FACHB-615]